jgi:hypothetical protein
VTALISRRVLVAESDAGGLATMLERGWGDGLPVVPPTPERVEGMLAASGADPAERIAAIPPRWGALTFEKLAINAVMAGCLPEYVPVLAAAMRAMAEPEFNLAGIQTTTNPAAPLVVVSGPVAEAIGMNSGRGALGPGNRANATIGRAVRLILMNVGGARPGGEDRAVHGMPGKYSFCFAEDVEGSPWGALVASRGLGDADSGVTVIGSQGTTNVLAITERPEELLGLMADALAYQGSNNVQTGNGEPAFVLTRGHAAALHGAGYTRAAVQRELYERARRPRDGFAWKTPLNEWNELDGHVYPCARPEDILLIVAGGPEPYHVCHLPSFGETTAVAREVVMP